MRVALKFAYNGQNFSGYARQPGLKTVEGEVIKILVKHGFIEDTKEAVLRSASRTDKGVSALCNAVAFNTFSIKKQALKTLSKYTDDIIFYALSEVKPDFNPRHAKTRIYRYYLRSVNLDFEKLTKTLAVFTGEHDFTNFARVEYLKNPVRKIENIVVVESDDFFIIDFYAPNFLWNQIRRIISAVQKVGLGKISRQEIVRGLTNPEKKIDFNIAPAEPLILKDIFYDFEFEYEQKLFEKINNIQKEVISKL
jgi:tRNA pseudouridine38-40 synthase